MVRTWVCASLLSVCCVLSMWAQQPTTAATGAIVPQLVNFSGTLTDLNGKPLTGVVGVTFLLYKEEQGGAPLWLETQNVQLDKSGHYSVLLGSTSRVGLPADIFVAGEARWLGLQLQGQAEQPRVMLLSVPYALKAVDAQTIGGLPPSAFALAAPPQSAVTSTATPAANAAAGAPPPSPPVTGTGTVNFVPLWDSTSDIISSGIFQSGSGSTAKVGINTTKPATALDVKGGSTIRGLLSLPSAGTATSSGGKNSQPLDQAASAFNSSTNTAVPQTFQWQAEPVGNNTSNTSGSLNLLFAQGSGKPVETGLNIASNGRITFAKGQIFSGTGTVTNVGSGLGLTGGPITSAGTLSIDTSVVPQLVTANNFTGNQTVNGNVSATQLISKAVQGTAPLQVTSSTQVPNLNASFLDGLSASAFQVAGSYATLGANTFSATQTVTSGDVSVSNGNLDLPATSSASTGVMNLGGTPFIHACCSNSEKNIFAGLNAGNFTTTGVNNAALGFGALNANTKGSFNTAVGHDALVSNTTGGQNTAIGIGALELSTTAVFNTATGEGALGQTTGSSNTAMGDKAGLTNIAGTQNTFLGAIADAGSGSLTNATAVGASAQVTASNAMVLGSIAGVNGATSNVNVGIGTTAPASTLDVHGTGNFTGLVTFASGQTFPGTVGSVTAGTDLTNTGTSGNPILNVDTTKVVTGVIAGTDLVGGGTGGVQTLSLDTTKVPLLNAANTFTGNQTMNGNLSATGAVTGSSFQIGANLFAFGSFAASNAFLGFAGNTTMSGAGNTASGLAALFSNTTGGENTASGGEALFSNTTGGSNTASGYEALFSNTGDSNRNGSSNTASGWGALRENTLGNNNTASGALALYNNVTGSSNTAVGFGALLGNQTGSYNTAIGFYANMGALTNATAIGAYAAVTSNNALVLGSINGLNTANASTNVGIGTTAPTYLLHIGNTGGANYNNFLRVEGPTQQLTGTWATSFGGYGNFGIDAVGYPGGRFYVLENGVVGIGCGQFFCGTGILAIGQGLGPAIADGWKQYSSRRWKTNIHTLHGALAKVEQLRGVSYDLKQSGKHEVGVIAEEVGAVVPEIVSWEKNGKDAYGVDYSRLTALLIEATKEQQVLIHKQQQQIKAQQMQMKAQQAQIETQEVQMKTQHAQIARLVSQVTAIQTSLNARSAPSSEVQRVNAQRPVMRQ